MAEQFLVDCAYGYSDENGFGAEGCSGAWPQAYLHYFKHVTNGQHQMESCYPYTAQDGTCKDDSTCFYKGEVTRSRRRHLVGWILRQSHFLVLVLITTTQFNTIMNRKVITQPLQKSKRTKIKYYLVILCNFAGATMASSISYWGTNDDELKALLVEYGPVVTSLNASPLGSYSGGIFDSWQCCDAASTGETCT